MTAREGNGVTGKLSCRNKLRNAFMDTSWAPGVLNVVSSRTSPDNTSGTLSPASSCRAGAIRGTVSWHM